MKLILLFKERINLFFVLLFLSPFVVSGQLPYTTNFSLVANWTSVPANNWTGYNEKTYTDGKWHFYSNSSVRGVTTENYDGSTHSFRERGDFKVKNLEMVSNMSGFSFQFRDWMTNDGKQRNLKISFDGGDSWTNIGIINKVWFSDYQVYQPFIYYFPDGVKSFEAEKFQIVLEGGENHNDGRINIGEFKAFGEITQVFAPNFSPSEVNVWQPFDVSLSSNTDGATIYYSFEGAEGPWLVYDDVLPVTQTTTIWTYAKKEGLDDSSVRSITYSFPLDVENIEALRNGTLDGQLYKLTGEAVATLFANNARNQFYIQDATAAILIDDEHGNLTTPYNVGDGVKGLLGYITPFNQMLQFSVVTDAGNANSTGNDVVPVVKTLNELSSHESQLVTVKSLTIDDVTGGDGTFQLSKSYSINDGTSSVLRTAYSFNYIGQPLPTTSVDITGVVQRFNAIYQIVPRSLSDIVVSTSTKNLNQLSQDPLVYVDALSQMLVVKASTVITQIDIINLSGSTVKSIQNNSNNVSASLVDISAGVYVVRAVLSNGSVAVKKIVNK